MSGKQSPYKKRRRKKDQLYPTLIYAVTQVFTMGTTSGILYTAMVCKYISSQFNAWIYTHIRQVSTRKWNNSNYLIRSRTRSRHITLSYQKLFWCLEQVMSAKSISTRQSYMHTTSNDSAFIGLLQMYHWVGFDSAKHCTMSRESWWALLWETKRQSPSNSAGQYNNATKSIRVK